MVGALAFVVVLVAWNQQNKVAEVCLIVGCGAQWKRPSENFSTVVDVKGFSELKARTGTNEPVQIAHGAAFLPYESV
jgi:hypothetical protein